MQSSVDHALDLSIVVCTRNRAELLADVLQTLGEQTLDGHLFEVVVVDNGSTDRTREVTEGFSRRYPNVRYCSELECGLSFARNRGWREARGQYVAYVDDDCKVPGQWLEEAKRIIDDLAPAVFGGPYFPFYHSPKPDWWSDSYGAFELSPVSRPLEDGEYLRGANLFFRRTLLSDMDGFNVELGMTGQTIAYGEETELQERIRASVPDECIYYDPELFVYHLVRSDKMTWRWILRSWFASGRSSYGIHLSSQAGPAYSSRITLFMQSVKTIIGGLAGLLVGMLRRDRERHPHFQNHLYENAIEPVQNLGLLFERYLRAKA